MKWQIEWNYGSEDNMGKVSMAVENAKWEAERDAMTLRDYAKLKGDARRYKKAIEYIEEESVKLSKVVSTIKEE